MKRKNRRQVLSEYSTLPTSRDMVGEAKQCEDTPQTCSDSYRLAFDDPDFLLKDEQRSVRLMLEWQKPEQILLDNNIKATWVVFGSARILEHQHLIDQKSSLENQIKQNPNDENLQNKLKAAESLLDKQHFYNECVRLTSLLAKTKQTGIEATVITGGGPGIMEAANRGAHQAGKDSIGLNIVLPREQQPNRFISPEYCFQFHYFAIRKMHFLVRAKALFAFPGGFGTLDEIMETLTLIQTGRIKRFPIFLFGRQFWNKIINFEALADEGMISYSDLELFHYVESSEEAIEIIKAFYHNS
ncbi:LOG family protein [Pleionea sediminis]|uniref:LOG family protein n=1 Tax=Pleionea sediminis TaxID=2569479 RepID=UPI001FE4CB62|nr:LOG family protein [Pleionea sediminis]